MDDIIRSWKDPDASDDGPDSPAGPLTAYEGEVYGGVKATTQHLGSWGCPGCHWLTFWNCS